MQMPRNAYRQTIGSVTEVAYHTSRHRSPWERFGECPAPLNNGKLYAKGWKTPYRKQLAFQVGGLCVGPITTPIKILQITETVSISTTMEVKENCGVCEIPDGDYLKLGSVLDTALFAT